MGTVPRPRRGRVVFAGTLACALAGLAVLLGATLVSGLSIWPPGEPPHRFGADPAELQAALARADAKAPLRIGIVGDIQHGVSELCDLLDAHREAGVDFLLQLGDAANKGKDARYAVLRHVFAEHAPGIPVVGVPGNHDIEPTETLDVWSAWMGEIPWRMDARGWRILGLDDSTGAISEASMGLVRDAAQGEQPACGTLVVAHRPLAAPEGSSEHDPEAVAAAARARHFARRDFAPTLTLSGHWHHNVTHADERGTVHVVLGENCDRPAHGDAPDVSVATLVLHPAVAEGVPAAAAHEFSVRRIPRRVTLRGEFLRLCVGEVYPSLRDRLVLAWAGVAVLALGALVCARAAWRGWRAPAA